MNVRLEHGNLWYLLSKRWGSSLMCASVVALSVGLAVLTCSAVYNQLLKPVGLPGSERWYSVQIAAGNISEAAGVDEYTYQELLRHKHSADYLGAFRNRRAVLSHGQTSISLRAGAVSPRLFAQVTPLMGRTFQEADARPGAPAVVILSFDIWQSHFGADPAIVGKSTRIDAAPVQIIGVMSQGFSAFEGRAVWLPLLTPNLARPLSSAQGHFPLIALGNAQNSQTILNEMKLVVDQVNRDYPELFPSAGREVVLVPAGRMFTYAGTPVMVLLSAVSAALLLVGALNIGMVFLSLLLERRRELALRTALGSSRSRLLWQCLWETAPIMLLGLTGGYGLAVLTARWIAERVTMQAQVLAAGQQAPPMFGFGPLGMAMAAAFTMAIWCLSTLTPAWLITRQDPAAVLAGSAKGSSSRGGNRSAGLLVGVQVIISSIVLVVCLSMVVAIEAELSKPMGVNTAGVVVSTSPTVFDTRFSDPARRVRYWDDLEAAIGSKLPDADIAFASAPPSKPGKVAASIDTQQGNGVRRSVTLPIAAVSEGYFGVLGLSLRSGRLFSRTDDSASRDVAIVDEELAARYWPGQDAVGKRIRLDPSNDGRWLTVVGVVSAVAGQPYRKEDTGVLYRPLRQAASPAFRLLARRTRLAENSRGALRAAAFAVDRDLPLNNLQMLEDYLVELKLPYTVVMSAFTVIAIIGALVTASGLFGLISRSVAHHTQEVGIRRALGATSWAATSTFIRQSVAYFSLAVLGAGLAIMMIPALSAVFTNIFHYAIHVALGVVCLMAIVIFTASYLPLRHAVELEPGDALRYD